MRICNVHIKNFRCIFDENIEFENLATLVGPNGSGKSAVLRAIDLFYQTKSTVTEDDYYNKDMSQAIEIAVTLKDLSEEEKGLFQKYVRDNMLTVTNIIQSGVEKYHGTIFQNPDFAEVRKGPRRSDIQDAYRKLLTREEYSVLPKVRSADDAENEMQKWELEHPKKCEWIRDEGQFFGFRQVGQAHLERYSRFIFVPAVRDAEQDALDRSGSAMYELMELLVRSVMAQEERFKEFKNRVQDEYKELISPEAIPQLESLGDRLTDSLRCYVPSASVRLSWETAESVNIPMPKADVKLEEDGFPSPVDKVGHGLQRAFILSMLQSLVAVQYQYQEQVGELGSSEESDEQIESSIGKLPDLILAIEEPELYQHPNRQRYLSKILSGLSEGGIAGVAERTQVIYSTHSPLFVDLFRFDSIRRLTKRPNSGVVTLPMITQIARTNMESIAKKLEAVQDERPERPFTSESLKARMVAIMTPWVNEGFFADVLVLVEGEDDRSAILGAARMMGFDFEGEGIAVIPCDGKASIDRPFLVFSELGIPTYLVFDGDGHEEEGKRGEKTNRILQRLLGVSNVRDVPRTEITERYATFETELDRFLRGRVGEEIYTKISLKFIRDYGYSGLNQCKKSPTFVQSILEEAKKGGITISELVEIVKNIKALSAKRRTADE